MKHHILVKFTPDVTDKAALTEEIRRLFRTADGIPGVGEARVFQNCIDRENRCDLMIVIDMDMEALPAWDSSALHRKWKADYGRFVAAKVVFDCE